MQRNKLRADFAECSRELQATRQTLENERMSRASYLAGDIRRFESDFKQLQDTLEHERVHYRRLIYNNKEYLAQAKKLGKEREQLLNEIATARSDLLVAKREIRNLQQQVVANHARSQRELRRELRKEILDAQAHAQEVEAFAQMSQAQAASDLQEAESRSRYADNQLKRLDSLIAASERRVAMKEHKLASDEASAEARAARAERRLHRMIESCENAVAAAEADVREAEDKAQAARNEAMDEAANAQEAEAAKTMAEYQNYLLKRQVARAKQKADGLQRSFKDLVPISSDRSAEEWASLCDDARRKAAQRERMGLRGFFSSHQWRAEDVATVLEEFGLLD